MLDRVVIVECTLTALKELMRLPDGAEIVAAHVPNDRNGTVLLRVSHPEFAPVPEGQVIPRVRPTYRRAQLDGGPEFVDWGGSV